MTSSWILTNRHMAAVVVRGVAAAVPLSFRARWRRSRLHGPPPVSSARVLVFSQTTTQCSDTSYVFVIATMHIHNSLVGKNGFKHYA
jgi:hypothetical protein